MKELDHLKQKFSGARARVGTRAGVGGWSALRHCCKGRFGLMHGSWKRISMISYWSGTERERF